MTSVISARAHPELHPWLRAAYEEYIAVLVTLGATYKDYLPFWLEEGPGRDPWIAVDAVREPVGFAFIGSNGFPFKHDDADAIVAEFYVAPQHRGRGLGRAIANEIFARYPGRWELAVLRRNEAALRFWRSVVPDAQVTRAKGVTRLRFVR